MNAKRKIKPLRMRIRRQTLLQHFDYEGISERELARVAGLSHTTIQNYLNGTSRTCNAASAKKIEKALGAPRMTIFVPDVSYVDSTQDGAAA